MTTQRNTAIVTGAASGIGRAMTLGLLGAGIDVAAVDCEAPWLDELKGAVAASRLSGQLQTLQSDLSDPASFDRIVAAVLGAAGRIDILVNNAGIGQGSIRADQRRNPLRFWDITPAQWDRFVAVNATAPLMLARAVVPHMLRAKQRPVCRHRSVRRISVAPRRSVLGDKPTRSLPRGFVPLSHTGVRRG